MCHISIRGLYNMTNIHLHSITAHVQDLCSVIQTLFTALRVRRQTQQVGVERHRHRVQGALVDLSCQKALLFQAGFISWEPPEMTHIQHLQQSLNNHDF